jgi:hypothetical protein
VRRYFGVLLVLGLAACSGGGGGGQALPRASGPSSAPTGRTASSLKILVPNATASSSSRSRRPAYISSSTQSMTIDVTPHLSQTSLPGFPLTVNLTPTSPGCASTAGGTVCNVAITADAGSYNATVATYDAMNATGNLLSAAQCVPFAVVLNQANTIPLVLGGTPVSMTLVASGGQVAAAHLSVFTLPGSASGTFAAYGVDADGNTIVGGGSPTVSATTDNSTQIAVTQPTASTPSAIGVTSLGANAIAHVTVTITPLAGAGAPLSKTVTVQDPVLSLLYIATNGVRVFDATGTDITPVGTAFDSLDQGPGGTGIAYDPANGFIYAADQNGAASFVMAFDKNGNQQPLNAGATGLPVIGGLTFDPSNGWIYAANENVALDAAGNQHLLSLPIPFSYNPTYDPQHGVIVSGTQTSNPDGSFHATLPFSGGVTGVAYNAANDWFYVATVYPTGMAAYDTSGNPQVLSGTFIDLSTEQIGGITADPVTGNIYLATNARNTYGFDRNGNPLPPPWHNISGTGSGSGAAGLAMVPP